MSIIRGKTISGAEKVVSLEGEELVPLADGSNEPRSVSMMVIRDYVEKGKLAIMDTEQQRQKMELQNIRGKPDDTEDALSLYGLKKRIDNESEWGEYGLTVIKLK